MSVDFHQGFQNNKLMSLPLYQTLNLKNASLEDLRNTLHQDMNLKHPVVVNAKGLDMDQQREVIGLIENYFVSNNLSFKFPYPILILSDHEPSITKIPLLSDSNLLPKFFNARDTKMNVKESHLASKNKLLQQEVKNADASSVNGQIESYGEAHRIIFQLEKERQFYLSIIGDLTKGKPHG